MLRDMIPASVRWSAAMEQLVTADFTSEISEVKLPPSDPVYTVEIRPVIPLRVRSIRAVRSNIDDRYLMSLNGVLSTTTLFRLPRHRSYRLAVSAFMHMW